MAVSCVGFGLRIDGWRRSAVRFVLPPSSLILHPCAVPSDIRLRAYGRAPTPSRSESSAFWSLNSDFCIVRVRQRPLDGWGSPCPPNGLRSCSRDSAGNSNRSGHCNSQRSGPMLGPRTSLRYSNPNSVRFRHCACALNRTRSSYRRGNRSCCRNGSRATVRNSVCSRLRNSVRSGPRSRTRNSRRSCFCNGIQPCARSIFPSLLPRLIGVAVLDWSRPDATVVSAPTPARI